MKIVLTRDKYKGHVLPEMKKKFGYKNDLAVPKINKVVVGCGIGKMLKEPDRVEEIIKALGLIAGQKPIKTKAKKAIAGFKIREGLDVGIKITLRGKKMWDFIDRIVNAALPRTRDFQGIDMKSVDDRGNLNIGIKEHVIFPEISPEEVKTNFGFQITVVSTAKNKTEGLELFRLLGFPLRQS